MHLRPVMTPLSLVALNIARSPAQSTGSTFYNVIRNNDIPALKQASRKPGAGVRSSGSTTPLIYAAALGSLDAMKPILDARAEINARNSLPAMSAWRSVPGWQSGASARICLRLHGPSFGTQSAGR